MARAVFKLCGAHVLTLLLTAVIMAAVLGAHAALGAHLELEQHEVIVHPTVRALVTFGGCRSESVLDGGCG
jgi:hypothetical protein